MSQSFLIIQTGQLVALAFHFHEDVGRDGDGAVAVVQLVDAGFGDGQVDESVSR